jgi:phenylacetate-coenzyme A ligase PaaK-like adenylate-forming protein
MEKFSPHEIFNPSFDFEKQALALFKIQAACNPVYNRYIQLLGITPDKVNSLQQIPFLPVELFKTQPVVTDFDFGFSGSPVRFISSGTTGTQSHHFLHAEWYQTVSQKIFEMFYGSLNQYIILALLPSYLEQKNSSLIFMMNHLMKVSGSAENGFYLNNHEELITLLKKLKSSAKKIWLIGVTYALLDLAEYMEQHGMKTFFSEFENLILMETGGMKGRRKERIRQEVHAMLKEKTGIASVHSEYGMTELTSQAYSKGEGKFAAPPWLRILIRHADDPYCYHQPGKTGGINLIDLANVSSCAFLATQDLGKLNDDGSFEISGRMQNSDVRGCNLMVS